MNKKEVHLTAEGKKDLEKELSDLIAKRPESSFSKSFLPSAVR